MANTKGKTKKQISTAKSRAAAANNAPDTLTLKAKDQAEVNIMDVLDKLPADEQTSVLNRVVKNLAIANFERRANAVLENEHKSSILMDFVAYHPAADKYIKEHLDAQQNQVKKA